MLTYVRVLSLTINTCFFIYIFRSFLICQFKKIQSNGKLVYIEILKVDQIEERA